MGKKKNAFRYLKITIITAVAALLIAGGVFGTIYDKDRIVLDIDKLKLSVNIATKINARISFEEGFIMMSQGENSDGRKIEIPTLKNIKIKGKTIQVNFKSLLFKDSIVIKKTNLLQTHLEKYLIEQIAGWENYYRGIRPTPPVLKNTTQPGTIKEMNPKKPALSLALPWQ